MPILEKIGLKSNGQDQIFITHAKNPGDLGTVTSIVPGIARIGRRRKNGQGNETVLIGTVKWNFGHVINSYNVF